MNREQSPFGRLDTLVESLAAGGLAEDDRAEFERILVSDQQARQRYLERMFLIGSLRWMCVGRATVRRFPAGEHNG